MTSSGWERKGRNKWWVAEGMAQMAEGERGKVMSAAGQREGCKRQRVGERRLPEAVGKKGKAARSDGWEKVGHKMRRVGIARPSEAAHVSGKAVRSGRLEREAHLRL